MTERLVQTMVHPEYIRQQTKVRVIADAHITEQHWVLVNVLDMQDTFRLYCLGRTHILILEVFIKLVGQAFLPGH